MPYPHLPHTGNPLPNSTFFGQISNFGTGYEFIDAAAAAKRGIPVGHTPGCLSDAVADIGMGLLVASARDLVGGALRAAAPGFDRINNDDLGKQVSGATLGIVGMGGIGLEVARRAAGFKMRVLYHNRRRASPEAEAIANGATFFPVLNDMLPECDFVMIVVPATAETTKMFGAPQFKAMRCDAHLINIARGVVVDQDALVAALAAGELGACALDVTEPEPLPREHPLVATAGTPLEGRVLITPHQGSATMTTRLQMLRMAFDNVEAGLDPAKPRLPWVVDECRSCFPEGTSVGAVRWSDRPPKP